MPITVPSYQIDSSNTLHFYGSQAADPKMELDSIGATGMHVSGIKVYTKHTFLDKVRYAWNKLLGNTVDIEVQTQSRSSPEVLTVDKKFLEDFLRRNSGTDNRSPGLEKTLQSVLDSLHEKPKTVMDFGKRKPAPLAVPDRKEAPITIMPPTPAPLPKVNVGELLNNLATGPKQAQPKTKVAKSLQDLGNRMEKARVTANQLTKEEAIQILDELFKNYPTSLREASSKHVGKTPLGTIEHFLTQLHQASRKPSLSFDIGISSPDCAAAWRLLDNLRIQALKT